MNDSMREYMSYFGISGKMLLAKKHITPECVSFGMDNERYFLYYEPEEVLSDKIIVWVHGGGWNSGSPKSFDFVGQSIAAEGYRVVSIGYRLAPKNKYPKPLIDVSLGYRCAMGYLENTGIDTSKVILVGPSAGAHLTSIFCYNDAVRKKTGTDISNIIGYVGFGGPYAFTKDTGKAMRMLYSQLFRKGYDLRNGEPVNLMQKSDIPMLLIQSRHDGLIPYSCAERFAEKAAALGNKCELYTVTDKKDTHSWYTAGLFLETREKNKALDKFYSWIEAQ